MNKEQYKRIRNLVNKLKAQADSEGFTVAEFDLLLTKFLPTQGYALADWKKAEKKWENKIEVDYSNTPSIFVGERGPEGPKGRDSTIPGPMGPAIPGPRGKKGDRGPQGKTGTITTEDFNRLRERLYAEQLKPADLDKKLNERFDGINKKLREFVPTSVLEPSVKEIVTPELNRILRSFQSSIYAAMQDAKKALNAVSGGTVTEVSVVTANGVSGTVATATTTPAITLTLGAITPTTVNGLTFTSAATGFTVAGGTTSKTLTVSNTLTLAGTDTSTLNIGTGGTLGTAAFTAATAYAAALGADDNYVTDAQLVVIGNTSGTNTGDNAANSSSTYIGTTAVALNRASAALTLAGI